MKINVQHGSLHATKTPVLLGYYTGDDIVDDAALLDRIMDNELRRAYDQGLYPEHLGEVVLLHGKDTRIPTAIVVGLGVHHDLTPARLRKAVHKACQTYLYHAGQCESLAAGRATLTTMAMGCGDLGPMAVETAITAMLQGVLDASRTGEQFKLRSLTFIERYQDLALEVAHALDTAKERLRLPSKLAGDLVVDPHLRRPGIGYCGIRLRPRHAHNRWTSTYVAMDSESSSENLGVLHYGSETDKGTYARASYRFDRRDVRKIRGWAPRPHRLLFTRNSLLRLIPEVVYEELSRGIGVRLVVDRHTADIPWELLCGYSDVTRADSISWGMVRLLATMPSANRPPATGNRALVIADPARGTNGPAHLPNARSEGEALTTDLKDSGFSVTSLINADAASIKRALHEPGSQYRILHIAAHGWKATGTSESPSSFVVLGNGYQLDRQDFEHLSHAPEVVFVNCCGLATLAADDDATEYTRESLLLARAFFNIGVKAIVMAAWDIDDEPAELFSRVFYQHLLAGESFGRSVSEARQQTQRKYGDTSQTWAAYQCYGDPAFRLRGSRSNIVHREIAPPRYLSDRQVEDDLVSLLGDLRVYPTSDTIHFRTRLQQMWNAGQHFRETAPLSERFGDAYIDLCGANHQLMAHALACYRRAATHPGGRARVRVLENLADVGSRLAWRRVALAGESRTGHADELQRAIDALHALARVAPAREAFRFLGQAHMRLAALRIDSIEAEPQGWREALTRGQRAFLDGLDWYQKHGPDCPVSMQHYAIRAEGIIASVLLDDQDVIDRLRSLHQYARTHLPTGETIRTNMPAADLTLALEYANGYIDVPAMCQRYQQIFDRSATMNAQTATWERLLWTASLTERALPATHLAERLRAIADAIAPFDADIWQTSLIRANDVFEADSDIDLEIVDVTQPMYDSASGIGKIQLFCHHTDTDTDNDSISLGRVDDAIEAELDITDRITPQSASA